MVYNYFVMYKDIKVIDCHVHNFINLNADYLVNFLDKTGTDIAVLLACQNTKCLSLVPNALRIKEKYIDRFYCFSCPDVSSYTLNSHNLGEYLKDYTNRLIAMGSDGIKLLEGKPQMRKMYPIPDFDHVIWEPFWTNLEENEIPVMFHVNDPEEFWDISIAPKFAIKEGWLYDSSYINNEVQYTQVLNVLKKHPNLKICFPHFFFMSRHLDRLSKLLDTYKNVMIDLTPGIEMYENFSNNLDETKSFFNKYHDRIMYGTDIGGRCVLGKAEGRAFDEEENLIRPEIVRAFLGESNEIEIKSDGHYIVDRPPFTMKCLNLKRDNIDEILNKNFLEFVGNPKKVDLNLVKEEEEYELKRLNILKEKN